MNKNKHHIPLHHLFIVFGSVFAVAILIFVLTFGLAYAQGR